MKKEVVTFVLFTENGHFSLGYSLPEAMSNLLKGGANRGQVSPALFLSLVIGDEAPGVDVYGGISYGGKGKESAFLVKVGAIGTFKSVRRNLAACGYSL